MTAAVSTGLTADQARNLTDRIKVAVEGTWLLIEEAYQSRVWAALGYTSWDDYMTREFGTSRLRLPREERTEVVGSLRDAGLSIRAIASATGLARNTVRDTMREVGQSDPPVSPAADVIDDHYEPVTDDEADYFDSLADVDENTFEEAIATARADGDLSREHLTSVINQAKTEPTVTPEPTKVTGTDGKKYTVPAPAPKQERRKPLTDVARDKGFALRSAMDSVERIFDDNRYRNNEEQVAVALRGHLLHVQDRVSALLEQLPSN